MVETRRRQIEDVASEMFHDQGYAATGVRDIARALDIQGASLYAHVTSKEAVLWAIVERAASMFESAADRAPTRPAADPRRRALRALVVGHVGVVTGGPEAATVFDREWRHLEDPRRDEIRGAPRRLRGPVPAASSRTASRPATSSRVDPVDRSAFLLTALNAVGTWYRPGRTRSPASSRTPTPTSRCARSRGTVHDRPARARAGPRRPPSGAPSRFNDEALPHDARYRRVRRPRPGRRQDRADRLDARRVPAGVLRFVEMHANSELMGVLPERDWILRAPTLRRKLALTAKIQDEVGHAQLLYRVAEDLGKPREAMIEDLLAGKTKFHNVFHYPTRTWADIGVIAWLVDAAAIVAQQALRDSSYAPYARTMRKICWEESVHIMHGRDVVVTLATGTPDQRAMLQEALDRWWPPLMQMHGPRSPREKDRDLFWRIKAKTSEELRQEFLGIYVPRDPRARADAPRPGAAPGRGHRRVALHRARLGRAAGRRHRATGRRPPSGSPSGRPAGTSRPGYGPRSPARRPAAA